MALFGNAAPLTPAKTGKASKPAKKEIAIEGLESLAQVDAAIKALEGIKASLEPKVKATAFTAFVNMADGVKPDSFTGVDGQATASMELRKRGTNSALKVDEVILLQKHGINPLKEVTCPELFAINPKYAGDATLLGKVEAALSDIVPADFIVQQAEISKQVVTEENVGAVFAAKTKLTRDEFEALVKVVTTQAIKAKLAETNFEKIMANVAKLVAADATEIEEA
jgi:hypothetical protein